MKNLRVKNHFITLDLFTGTPSLSAFSLFFYLFETYSGSSAAAAAFGGQQNFLANQKIFHIA